MNAVIRGFVGGLVAMVLYTLLIGATIRGTGVSGLSVNNCTTVNGLLRLSATSTTGCSILSDDATSLITQQNGVTAQEFRIENTFTDASNREFTSLGFINNANVFTLQTEALGTGTVRDFALMGGSVGIRNTSPLKFLHVGAGADAPVFGTNGIYVSNAGATAIAVRDSTGDAEGILYVDSGGPIYGSATNHNVVFRSNNSDRIIILAGGDVGIGLAAPTARLHVGGDVARPFSIARSTVAVTAPGAGVGLLRWETGTNAGTLKLVAYSGTSTTGVTIVDNVGAGN